MEQEYEREPEQGEDMESIQCGYCFGETNYIGLLGTAHIFRCRNCGLESFKGGADDA